MHTRRTCRAEWPTHVAIGLLICLGIVMIQVPRRSLADQGGVAVSVVWRDMTLRAALDSLADGQKITVWLDRRVDPHQVIHYSGRDLPALELVRQCVQTRGLSAVQLGPVIYVGPPSTAQKVATIERLRQRDVQALPDPLRSDWQKTSMLTWQELDTPRDILARVAQELRCTLTTSDKVPHDLWRTRELPPLDRVQQLTLMLANFDLTFRIDRTGRRIRWEPIPEEVRWHSVYPRSARSIDWAALRARYPTLRWTENRRELVLDGPVEAHDEYLRLAATPPSRATTGPPVREQDRRYTLTAKQLPLQEVLLAIAQQTGHEVKWESNAPRRSQVTFSVQMATLEQLLDAVTQGTQLRYEITGSQLRLLDR